MPLGIRLVCPGIDVSVPDSLIQSTHCKKNGHHAIARRPIPSPRAEHEDGIIMRVRW